MANLLSGLAYPKSAYEQANAPMPLPPVNFKPSFTTLTQTSARQDLPYGQKPVGRTDPSSIERAAMLVPAPNADNTQNLFAGLLKREEEFGDKLNRFVGFDPDRPDFAAPQLFDQTPPNTMLMSLADRLDAEAATNKQLAAQARAKSPFLRRIFYPLHRQLNDEEKVRQDAAVALATKALATRQAAVTEGIRDLQTRAGLMQGRMQLAPTLRAGGPLETASSLAGLEEQMYKNLLAPYTAQTARMAAAAAGGRSGKTGTDARAVIDQLPIGELYKATPAILEESFTIDANTKETLGSAISAATTKLANMTALLGPRMEQGDFLPPQYRDALVTQVVNSWKDAPESAQADVPPQLVNAVAQTLEALTPIEVRQRLAEESTKTGALVKDFFLERARQQINNIIESRNPLGSLGN